METNEEAEFAKNYVVALFRRRSRSYENYRKKFSNIENRTSRFHIQEFVAKFYEFDDNFRFSTMTTCTYTVAIVFLYYLACTFTFLYSSRTTGQVIFIKSIIEYVLQIGELENFLRFDSLDQWYCFLELENSFHFQNEVTASSIVTVLIFACQLFYGMKNYKEHKQQLYKGIDEDIPLVTHFSSYRIASDSVHYSGFLVGYMAWGFVICFHAILLFSIIIRLIFSRSYDIETMLSVIVPIFIFYFLKSTFLRSISNILFTSSTERSLPKSTIMILKKRKSYATFLYFSFFAGIYS